MIMLNLGDYKRRVNYEIPKTFRLYDAVCIVGHGASKCVT